MKTSYYIDESGHSGDLVHTGEKLNFDGQPVFVMACIGIRDENQLQTEMARLRKKYRISSLELKSSILKKNPNLILELIEFICREGLPFFIEAVDKKYFLCMQLVNCHVLPEVSGVEISYQNNEVRKSFADFIYDFAPDDIFNRFIEACLAPSEHSLRHSFDGLLNFAMNKIYLGDVRSGIYHHTVKSLQDYEILREVDEAAHFKFLPIPDPSKRNKLIWILPNISAFCNIYARINLFQQGNLSDVRIVHDENKHIDEILIESKRVVESLVAQEMNLYTTAANYIFDQTASLSFAESTQSNGIQVADLLAGFVMRFFIERINDRWPSNRASRLAYNTLLLNSNVRNGVGLNLVVPLRMT